MAPEEELLQACKVLFGSNILLSRDFLRYLEVSGVKTAYRKRARETHPDLNPDVRGFKDRVGDFIRVQEAYESLMGYLSNRRGTTGLHGTRAWSGQHNIRPRPVHRPPNTGGSRASASRPKASAFRAAEQQDASGSGGARPADQNRTAGNANSFRAPIPRRRLLIGHYLYYAGRAEWRTVIQAVGWQMIQRPRIGELAGRVGWLRNCDVHRITAKRKQLERFGDTAIRLGLISEFQLKVLLAMQKRRQRRLGEFFVEQGLFTYEEMETLVKACSAHNESLAEPSRQAS